MIIVYTYLVTHHDDPAVVGTVLRTLTIEVSLSEMIAMVVQMYMALFYSARWLDIDFLPTGSTFIRFINVSKLIDLSYTSIPDRSPSL